MLHRQAGGYVYILFYMLIKSKEYSSSTLLTRHKIHSDTLKSFDTLLRTKPNYYLPKFIFKKHNKINYLHTLYHLPYLITLLQLNPNKFNTNKQNIT